jgi:hypothetical protein
MSADIAAAGNDYDIAEFDRSTMMSMRITEEMRSHWKLAAEVRGMSVSVMMRKAMEEYIANHRPKYRSAQNALLSSADAALRAA